MFVACLDYASANTFLEVSFGMKLHIRDNLRTNERNEYTAAHFPGAQKTLRNSRLYYNPPRVIMNLFGIVSNDSNG